MSEDMTLNEYQTLAKRTIDNTRPDVAIKYHALFGMVGEMGEIHSIYQKYYQGHEIDPVHLQKEVGDLLWFIAEFCTVQGWELEDIAKMNIEKLQARYPNGFDEEHSLHRKEGDI